MGSTFYTEVLMGKKKGELRTVWMAAHCPKRLKKHLIQQTNIPSSVDRISVDILPYVSYRILGFLLLGVVRIYLKKVEHLLSDCNNSLNEMRSHFEERKKSIINVVDLLPHRKRSDVNVGGMHAAEPSHRKRSNKFIEAMRAQFSSISLPDNFELDSFDLEVMDNETRDHVKHPEEITLNEASKSDRVGDHSSGEDHEEVSANFSDYAAAYALITNIPETSEERLRTRFLPEECLEPMLLGETDEEMELIVPSVEQQNPEEKNAKFLPHEVIFEEDDEHHVQEERIHGERPEEEEHTNEETVVSEMTSSETMRLKPSPDKCPLSIIVDATPNSKAHVASGKEKIEFVAVHTPASKERVRASRKRKCVFDEMIVIPNNVFKDWLTDSSDLVDTRRKAPSFLLASKERRIFNLPRSFLEPIVPSLPLDIRSRISSNKPELLEAVDDNVVTSSKVDIGSPNTHRALEVEAEAMAPSTPVTLSTSLRFSGFHGSGKANAAGPVSSAEFGEKERSSIKDAGLEEIIMNEESNSLDGDSQKTEKWSGRTKSVACYLHSKFSQREKRGVKEEALDLSDVLRDKRKKESATVFYELLVLKSGGYVDVKQEKAYEEILVVEKSKLKEVFGAGGTGCRSE